MLYELILINEIEQRAKIIFLSVTRKVTLLGIRNYPVDCQFCYTIVSIVILTW